MDQVDLFRRLAVALAIGLLIGLEQGWRQREDAEGGRTAGLRTHALTGLLGGICAALSVVSHPSVLATALVCFTAAFTLFAWFEAVSEKNFSVTSVVAAVLTFALGAYAVLGDQLMAVAAAVAMALLLALKDPLHSWVRQLSWLEVRAVLVLLAMSFLLLPVLPNRAIDPWGALNPAEIWLLAILIAGVSLGGYVAVKTMGDHAGIAIAALAGGLASSTATTLSFARLARDHHEAAPMLTGGILLAGVVMIVRVIVIALALAPSLIGQLLLPATAGALVLMTGGGFLILGRKKDDQESPSLLQLKNPFDVATALKLTALIAVIMLAAKVLSSISSTSGLYLLAAISGIADVDALTLSMARLSGSQVSLSDAAIAILMAVCMNTASKATMAAMIAGKAVGVTLAMFSGLAVAAISLVYLLVPKIQGLASPPLAPASLQQVLSVSASSLQL